MAEINIERKKKTMWPWVILLVIIIGLIAWALYELTNEPDEAEYETVPATGMLIPARPEEVYQTITVV